MYVSHVQIENFRNISHARIRCSPYVNVFYGGNAQGKTNLLEAIYYLGSGQSHRQVAESKLVKLDSIFFRLRALIESERGPIDLCCLYSLKGPKKIYLNGIPAPRIADGLGVLSVVMFSPEDLGSIKGEPALRRRLLDQTLSQLVPGHRRALRDYARVLAQRNRLLKLVRAGRSKALDLAIWNRRLAALAAPIHLVRQAYVEKIIPLAKYYYKKFSGLDDELRISYCPGAPICATMSREQLERQFLEELNRRKEEEINQGCTLLGPHRDDLQFELNGLDLRSCGSQSEQRTAVLSLKLAELAVFRCQKGIRPVLLLDDIFSELDGRRRDHLMANIASDVQVFLTTTELETVKGSLSQYVAARVEGGNITVA